jgi:hypothetical protein
VATETWSPDPVRCADERRRHLVRADDRFNGLDWLEVSRDQRRLTVFFLDKAPLDLVPGNFRLTGGRRVRDIRVTGITLCANEDPERDDCLVVEVDHPGDFSCYRLEVVEADERGRPTDRRREDFDPRYASLEVNFKVGCPSPLDCACPPAGSRVWPRPEIRYLARDYAGFRTLLLDRLALTAPDWVERHAPDLQLTLVETLAYVGDHLSYFQDAVATEAYLGTARLRTSVRRHARLVDYRMHEGSTAWTWVTIETDTDLDLSGDRLAFVTSLSARIAGAGATFTPDELAHIPTDTYQWFEPSVPGPVVIRAARSEIRFYTWGDSECCLPAGSTRATLVDPVEPPAAEDKDGKYEADEDKAGGYGEPADPDDGGMLLLAPGDVLVFVEVLGPRTGVPGDADPAHRHAVRLTRVRRGSDPLTGTAYVEVEWDAADALPFDLCLSTVGPPPACDLLDPVSVARGNVVLVDAGRTVEDPLGSVPVMAEQPPCEDGCPDPPVLRPGRFRPRLPRRPMTFRAPADVAGPAARPFSTDPRAALPQLEAYDGVRTWRPMPDLLASGSGDAHLVVEVDDEGVGWLRFGDDVLGRAPGGGAAFDSRYRVGNGPAGNVGADTVVHLVQPDRIDGATLRITNPLRATGGVAPEPVADVRMLAPRAFHRERQRAVTAGDYAELALRDFPAQLQRAAADLRWNGSWYEARVALDARGAPEPSELLIDQVESGLERYRRIGHDLRVSPARSVGVDITLLVCVAAHHRRADVTRVLLDRLGNRRLPDGRLGLFHPDAVTFGTAVSVSSLVAVAAAVEGVDSVTVTRLRRSDGIDEGALEAGVLRLRADEVARVDNDPGAPENGVLLIDPRGGR